MRFTPLSQNTSGESKQAHDRWQLPDQRVELFLGLQQQEHPGGCQVAQGRLHQERHPLVLLQLGEFGAADDIGH